MICFGVNFCMIKLNGIQEFFRNLKYFRLQTNLGKKKKNICGLLVQCHFLFAKRNVLMLVQPSTCGGSTMLLLSNNNVVESSQ